MKRWLLTGTASVLLISVGQAQQVMDGSDQAMSPDVVTKIRLVIGEGQRDPYGAQIDRLHYEMDAHRDPIYCGRVNFRGDDGLLVGFVPFAISSSSWTLTTGPDAAKAGC